MKPNMRWILLVSAYFFCGITLARPGNGDVPGSSVYAVNLPDDAKIPSDFLATFSKAEDQKDLVKLRDYIDKKDDLLKMSNDHLAQINSQIRIFDRYQLPTTNIETIQADLAKMEKYLMDKYRKVEIQLKELRNDMTLKTNTAFQLILSIGSLDLMIGEAIFQLRPIITQYSTVKNQQALVNANIATIKSDIHAAAEKVQEIFNINDHLDSTKLTIGIVFSIMILVLVGLFFFYLFKIKDTRVAEAFITVNGIQFIALFSLIIAIVLFGILQILEGKELAAMLSGISGFILGKAGLPNNNNPAPAPANNSANAQNGAGNAAIPNGGVSGG